MAPFLAKVKIFNFWPKTYHPPHPPTGMDWLCPGYSEVLAKQLTKYHGMLNATITIHDVVSVVQTGDLHIAVYDLANEILYVANARADYETGPAKAYDR